MTTNSRNYGTGSIRQRSANGYSIRYYGLPDSNGKRTQVEESVKGTKKQQSVYCGIVWPRPIEDFIPKKTATVKQFLNQWLDVYARTLAEKTQQGYRQLIKRLDHLRYLFSCNARSRKRGSSEDRGKVAWKIN